MIIKLYLIYALCLNSTILTIPEQLFLLRKTDRSVNFTQAEVGDLIDMKAGAICNYEKGRRPIRVADFQLIEALCKLEAKRKKTKPISKIKTT
jgi:predicted transcriptional regulator